MQSNKLQKKTCERGTYMLYLKITIKNKNSN